MDEKWIVISRGGGSEERPEECRACGSFTSFEIAEHWMVQEFGEKMSKATRDYFEPQAIRIETPEEF